MLNHFICLLWAVTQSTMILLIIFYALVCIYNDMDFVQPVCYALVFVMWVIVMNLIIMMGTGIHSKVAVDE